MPRKTRNDLQEQGKVRGVTNKDQESLKDLLSHFNFDPTFEEPDASED